ncbi:GntR family transcriptional regulator [Labrys monachus]|uniref:DNA-binding GntR family transcriptional regulator n=1 Tax=Labrys monachus TaxID=217067 RepID=A0ABU0F6R4_9HYPH|nr:GntR family transcriptional regulator [Labrys monachus]MDQ0390307.1 DNA-binding GntR family transcriptional regulator [Labrys monachus]
MVISRPLRMPRKSLQRGQPAPIGRARPLHEEVVDRLRDMIIEGIIPPGERLHETNLSETLNVSRTPLREALKLLANEGMVELLPGRGARVSQLTPEGVGELFEVIGGLERLAAELAVTRMTARDLDRLKRMHDRMAEHFAAGERQDYFVLNHQIHIAIVAAARNETLAATHATLMVKARWGRYSALASAERWAEAMAEHEALMAALEARDGRLAGDVLYRHDRRTGETTEQMLRASAKPA